MDRDADETMTTSTSSTPSALHDIHDADADEGFEDSPYTEHMNPATHRPHTPANDHLNAAIQGELSPPTSQSHTDDMTSNYPESGTAQDTMANGTATRSSARLANTQSRPMGEGDTSAAFNSTGGEGADQPGWGWKNKKAQEEMQRAWDNIIDRDFSLKEFGDVVLQGKAQIGEQ